MRYVMSNVQLTLKFRDIESLSKTSISGASLGDAKRILPRGGGLTTRVAISKYYKTLLKYKDNS